MATSDFGPRFDTQSLQPGYRRNSGTAWTIGIIVIIAIIAAFIWVRPAVNGSTAPADNMAAPAQINSAPAVSPPMTTPAPSMTPAPAPSPAPAPQP